MNPGKKTDGIDPLEHAQLKAAYADLEQRFVELAKDLDAAHGETEAVNVEMEKLKDLAARAQADLQNAKGRVEREGAELRKFAAEELIRKLLPIVDNLQRAFQHLPDDLKNHEWVKGVTAIEQAFMRELSSLGLARMNSLGQTADPAKHEILQSGSGKQGTITEVFEEGYELHGKVLRPARVKVGDGSSL